MKTISSRQKAVSVLKTIFLPAGIFIMATIIISIKSPSMARADEWAPAWGVIEQLLVDDRGVQVIIRQPPDPPDTFDQLIERAFHLHLSADNYDVKAAALLSAYFAGHEVSIYYQGTLNSWGTDIVQFKVRPVSP